MSTTSTTLAVLPDGVGSGGMSIVEKVGGFSPLETMAVYCGASLPESTRSAIDSKTHPAMPEPPEMSWRWYVSWGWSFYSSSRIFCTTSFAIRGDLKLIVHLSQLGSD